MFQMDEKVERKIKRRNFIFFSLKPSLSNRILPIPLSPCPAPASLPHQR